MVIVDEFHHAEAATYRRLLAHLQPQILIGLTATPERTDGEDVRSWFDGRIAVELRLWEALERGLLSPFQYFGIADDVDVSGVTWTRGRYDQSDLGRRYVDNRDRAAKVIAATREKVADVGGMRALGFCVISRARALHGSAVRGGRHSFRRGLGRDSGDQSVVERSRICETGISRPCLQ